MNIYIFPLRLIFLSVAAPLLLAGCGGTSGPELASVSGTVTLNGQPLPNAVVQFQPAVPQGSYSAGRTDETGYFELRFTRDRSGALIGTHRVSVTTAASDAEDESGNPQPVAERVPAEYNERSTLVRDVERGTNVIDLALTGEVKTARSAKARR